MNVVDLPVAPLDLAEPDWEALIPHPHECEQLDEGALSFNASEAREVARLEWARIVAALRAAETLAPVNGRQIQRLILAYVRHDHATAETIRTGGVRLAPKTKVQMLNLWSTIAGQTSAEAATLEAELGLTPRRRGAVTKLQSKQRAARASDGYMRPGAAAGPRHGVG